jgi:hypothetical protein
MVVRKVLTRHYGRCLQPLPGRLMPSGSGGQVRASRAMPYPGGAPGHFNKEPTL